MPISFIALENWATAIVLDSGWIGWVLHEYMAMAQLFQTKKLTLILIKMSIIAEKQCQQ